MMKSRVALPAFFLALASVGFVADAMRVQLEGKDPSTLPAVETGVPRLSNRVVLVIIDSLAVRVGTDPAIMPGLVALAKRGASGILRAPPDTVTTAGIRAMSVGTKPSFRDTLDIFSHKPFPHWTVFDEIKARGEGVGLYGCHAWHDLLGDRSTNQPDLPSSSFYDDDQAATSEAQTRLQSNDRSAFVVLHISRTDFFAHQYGTERPEYRQELHKADEDLTRFFEAVYRPGTTFIVTSDHGNDLYGNHGGSGEIYRRVPVVLIGAGIRPVHDFVMEGRQMPLLLATLLGTRLPGGILQPLPPGILDLAPSDDAKLAAANLARLRTLASFLDVNPPGAATAGELIADVEVSSKPDPGLLIWVAVLLLAMVLTYVTAVTPFEVSPLSTLIGCALLSILIVTSRFRLPELVFLGVSELALVAVAVFRMRDSRSRIGAGIALAGVGAVVAISGARFALGGQYLFSLAPPLGVIALIGVGALWFFKAKVREVWAMASGLERVVIPVVMVTLLILQPIECVPMLLGAVLVLGVQRRWLGAAGATAALFLFFLFSQRIGFAWTGERLWLRYLYAFLAGGLATGLAAAVAGSTRRWFVPAALALLPLWAFGFLKFGHAWDTGPAQTRLLLLAWATATLFAWQAGCLRLCAIPLATSLIYHLIPGNASFWTSFAAHLAFLAMASLRPSTPEAKRLSIAGLLLSFLYLISSGGDFLSLMLFSVVLLMMAKDLDTDEGTLPLFGALIVVAVRYGILDGFGHANGAPYALSNIDTHSGFATMDKDIALWIPTTIIVAKILWASILVYSMILINPRYRRQEGAIALVSFGLILAFLVESAIELALSYGANEGRISMSIVQVIFHAGILLIMIGGYAGYRLLTIRGESGEPA